MEKFFKLKAAGTTVRTEIIAGLTTFFTMAYIIFVNPLILGASGMNPDGVFVATVIAAAIGTLVMALVANVPYATAPGMGLNAFFTYTVCMQLGFKWQEALAMVFICGLINILITVTKVRKAIVHSIPQSIQNAIGGGIGLFIGYIGIKNAGLLKFSMDPGTYTVFGTDPATSAASANSAIVPGLVNLNSAPVLLALIGLLITIILMVRKVPGAIFIGIILSTIIGIPMGVTHIPNKLFDLSQVGGIKDVAFAFFGTPGLGSLFSDPEKLPTVLITIFSFSLSDTFDTIGTFIGTGRKTGIFDAEDEKALANNPGFKSKLDKALFADSTATSIGALLGTSNTTTYVESAAGIGAGGKTGLTALTTAVMFLLCIPFASLVGIVPAQATAPALIIVGILMAESIGNINWLDFEMAVPAFMTIAVMAFAYNISYGIAAGFIAYCLVKIVAGKIKEVHPIVMGAAVLFVINFILLAVQNN